MTIGLIGISGYDQKFIQSGQSIPVTVIKIEKGRVIDGEKEKRGYSAIKVGYFKVKNSLLNK